MEVLLPISIWISSKETERHLLTFHCENVCQNPVILEQQNYSMKC